MRPQQYHLSSPLTPVQIENMDAMFTTLFKAINGGQITVDTSQVASGVLPMANGGTGSASLDTGGIVYSTGTTLTTDAANLFWDSANKRLGIGTNVPKHGLEVVPDNPVGHIVIGGNGPNIACNAYYSAGWKYLSNGFAGVVSLQDTSSGDFVVYTAVSGLAGGAVALLDRLHVLNNGNVGIKTSAPSTALEVTGTGTASVAFTSPTTIGSTSLQVGSDSTSLFRDTTIETTGIAVRDSANASYRALRVSNFGIANTGSIITISNGQITNVSDGAWKIQNQANTSVIQWQTNAVYLSHEAAGNAITANGAGIFLLSNEAQTIGFTLNGSTADICKIKNRANNADAALTASTGTFSSLTSGRVTFAGTGGLLSDDADLTFSVDTLTATKMSSTKYTLSGAQTYAASNVTTDRTYDANATTLDEVADVLGTLIADLRSAGLVV